MQAGTTFCSSIEHQVEALKLLKLLHLQHTANGNNSFQPRGDDRCGSEKKKRVAAGLDINSPLYYASGRTHVKSGSDSTTGVSTGQAVRTIAEKARESILFRLTEIADEVISVEEELCHSASTDQMLSLHPKDSVELRNICARMSAGDTFCRLSEQDLKELRHCLRRIVDSLLRSFTDNCLSVTQATRRLEVICATFPDF